MDMANDALQKAIADEGRRLIREALDLWKQDHDSKKGMTLMEYQEAAQRTSNTHLSDSKIENGLFGLAGEVGELCDLYKKYRFQGHGFDRGHMISELGDVLWYVVELACGLDASLDVVAQTNIIKLRARYPEGFDANRSLHRAEGDE